MFPHNFFVESLLVYELSDKYDEVAPLKGDLVNSLLPINTSKCKIHYMGEAPSLQVAESTMGWFE